MPRTCFSFKEDCDASPFCWELKNITIWIWLPLDSLDTFPIANRDVRDLRDRASRKGRDATIPTGTLDHPERIRATRPVAVRAASCWDTGRLMVVSGCAPDTGRCSSQPMPPAQGQTRAVRHQARAVPDTLAWRRSNSVN